MTRPGWLLLVAVGVAVGQTPPPVSQASAQIVAEKTALIVGEQVRFTLVVRSADGSLRTGLRVAWTTENGSIVSVSDGLVTARGIGVTRVRGAVEGEPQWAAAVNVQSRPRRLEVLPGEAKLTVGDTQQYTARAFDVNNQPIGNVPVQWRVFADSRAGLPGNTISNAGLLTTQAYGRMNVSAIIPFGGVANGPDSMEAITRVIIEPPKHYDIRAIWRSSRPQQDITYRTTNAGGDSVRGNAAGQIVFQGISESSTSLLLLDKGHLRMLSATGDPTAERNEGAELLTRIDSVSLNNIGETLFRGGTQLISASGDSVKPRFLNSSALAYNPQADRLEPVNAYNPQTSRHSLNDLGDAVAWMAYSPLLRNEQYLSLFRIGVSGDIQELVSSRVPLPGMAAGYRILPWHFGITNDRRVFFIAGLGRDMSLYALDPSSPGAKEPVVERILGVGDVFQGGRINSLDISASPPAMYVGLDGELILGMSVEGRGSLFARWRDGNWRQAPEVRQFNCICGVYSSNEAGALIRNNNASTGGQGLVRWKRDGSVEAVLLVNAEIAPGERVSDIQGAAMDGAGVVTALVTTTRSPSVLVRLAAGAIQILLRTDDAIPVRPRGSITRLLQGTPSGDVWGITAGGSVGEITDRGLEVRLKVAEPIAGTAGQRFPGTVDSMAVHVSDGAEVGTAQGLLRLRSDGSHELLHSFAAGWGPGARLGVRSEDGTRAVIVSQTNEERVFLISPSGESRLIGVSGANPADRLRFDDVEVTGFPDRPWVTSDGRVGLPVVTARGTALGLWENGVWRAIAVPGRTPIGGEGQLLAEIRQFSVSGNRIFANTVLSGGGMVLSEWTNNAWEPRVTQSHRLPNGTSSTWIRLLAVNSKGEAVIGTGDAVLAVYRGEQGFRQLLQPGDSYDEDTGITFSDVVLRDDGTAYLLGNSRMGEQIVYKATPK